MQRLVSGRFVIICDKTDFHAHGVTALLMSSLAELPEVIGFFSYSRDDDKSYKGRLSALREAIQHELGAQLGRSRTTFRLWQDKEAIAPGKLWEQEITGAVAQSVFFIPIVTPRAINSNYCKFEFEAFLARERALERTDLVFPILYVPVPALANEGQWRNHPILSVIGRRQYVDWQTFRYADVHTPAMREDIARFCNKIVEALQQAWLSRRNDSSRKRLKHRRAQRLNANVRKPKLSGVPKRNNAKSVRPRRSGSRHNDGSRRWSAAPGRRGAENRPRGKRRRRPRKSGASLPARLQKSLRTA